MSDTGIEIAAQVFKQIQWARIHLIRLGTSNLTTAAGQQDIMLGHMLKAGEDAMKGTFAELTTRPARERCSQCRKKFPADLITSMEVEGKPRPGQRTIVTVCPICALHIRNEQNRLPKDTPFKGEIARNVYARAVAYLEKQNKGKRK